MSRRLEAVLGVLMLLLVAGVKLTDAALHRKRPEPVTVPAPATTPTSPEANPDQDQDDARARAVFLLPFILGGPNDQ